MIALLSRRLLAFVLVVAIVAPAAFLAGPPKVHAIGPVTVVGDTSWASLKRTVESTISVVKETITSVAAVAQEADTVLLVIDKYVLEPLAFIMSGHLLQAITSTILNFVGGKNGLAMAAFVQNLPRFIQGINDGQALSFLSQFAGSSNSIYANSIASSLRTNYLQDTSEAGFFAANQSTLGLSSPNPSAYVQGDWSQGGVAAWFALTTQDQNNPYTLYYNAQSEMSRLSQNAIANQLAQLNWNQGFLSWCGDSPGPSVSGATTLASQAGLSPGDPCTKSDGTAGTIVTPGSIINGYLQKSLGSTIDKIVSIGDVAPEINTILGTIGQVTQTVNLTTQLFSGTGGSIASIFGTGGSGSASAYGASLTSGSYLGTDYSTVGTSASSAGLGSTDLQSRVSQFQAAWSTIGGAATTAKTNLNTIISTCADPGTVASAKNALATEVQPVLDQYTTAEVVVGDATALIEQTQNDLNTNSSAYSEDIAQQQSAPPSASDIASAQQQATSFGVDESATSGSLTVSALSQVDQMNLIAGNAQTIASSALCAAPAAGGAGGGGGGSAVGVAGD